MLDRKSELRELNTLVIIAHEVEIMSDTNRQDLYHETTKGFYLVSLNSLSCFSQVISNILYL